jgi:deoxycytidylate deaminase
MNQKVVNRYIEIARALKPRHQSGRSFHLTCIFDKSKLLAMGFNNYAKEHPRHKFGVYSATKPGSNYVSGIHSEISSIIRLGEEDCSRYTFLNIRLDNNNNPALAKPCPNCFRVLRNQVGFKRIYYTTSDSFEVISSV